MFVETWPVFLFESVAFKALNTRKKDNPQNGRKYLQMKQLTKE